MACVLFFLAAAGIFGQEPARLVPRKLLLAVSVPAGSSFGAGDVLMIERSLHERLQEAAPDVVVLEPGGADRIASADELSAAAAAEGADSWLLVSLDGDWSAARMHVRAFDLILRTAVADFAAQPRAWGSAGALAQESWADVAQAVSGKFPMLEAGAAPAAGQERVRLVIHAVPGSLITGLGDPALRVGNGGTSFRMLAPRKEYAFRTVRDGYLPVTTRIYLSGEREITVQQARPPFWGLEGSLSDSRVPGMDASVYFTSSLFARAGFSTYAVGLALDSTGVLLSMPLTVLSAQFGTYLAPEDRFFRFYLAAEGFVRIIHAPGTWPVMDGLSPAGFRVVTGVESPLSARGRLYFELTPSYYQTSQPDALRAALGSDTPPGWAFGPQQALNLLSFRFGYRWRP